jgi:hypothetical protein
MGREVIGSPEAQNAESNGGNRAGFTRLERHDGQGKRMDMRWRQKQMPQGSGEGEHTSLSI